jgi:predicted dehydrogenase
MQLFLKELMVERLMKINVALIGCGNHAENTIGPILKQQSQLGTLFCIDVELDRAKKLSCSLGGGGYFASIEEMPFVPDAFVLCLNPEATLDVSEQLAALNLPVFVEKGFSRKTSSIKLIGDRFLFSQVGFNFRFCSVVSSMIGDLSARKDRIENISIEFRSKNPRVNSRHDIEDWFRLNGVHAIDLSSMLIGQADHVSGMFQYSKNNTFQSAIMLESAAGQSSVTLSNRTKRFVFSLRAFSVKGCEYEIHDLKTCYRTDSGGEKALIYERRDLAVLPDAAGYWSEIFHFFGCVLEKKSLWSPSISDAMHASSVCDRIFGNNA